MPEYSPADRRPIAARELGLSRKAAGLLVRMGVSANAISVLGMLACLAAGAAFASTAHYPAYARGAWIAGALLVQLRLLANMLDGMVAIGSGKASPVGELYNDVPDRVSDAAVFIGLGYAAGGRPDLGYLAAIAAILTAYIRVVGKAGGAPADFCGPMAKQHRMFLVTLLGLYGGLAPATWTHPAATWALAVILAGSVVTCLRRLFRIARALRAP